MLDLDIDIAIDLNGFTTHARTGIIALRPAPIQANFLGFAGTMGAEFIDYIVADATVIPEGAEAHYAEHVVRLPDAGLVEIPARFLIHSFRAGNSSL